MVSYGRIAGSVSSRISLKRYQGKLPTHEIRLGRIRAAVWRNETDNGPRYNVQISRLDKDKADKWKDSSSFGREDLPLVGKVADLAMVWIYENPVVAEK